MEDSGGNYLEVSLCYDTGSPQRLKSAFSRCRITNKVTPRSAWSNSRESSPQGERVPPPQYGRSISRRSGTRRKSSVATAAVHKTPVSRNGHQPTPGGSSPWTGSNSDLRRMSTSRTPMSRPPSSRSSVEVPEPSSRQAKPATAWQVLENQIKEINDTMPFFTKRHRTFRSSEAFKQVLTDIDFTPPVSITRGDSHFDLDSLGAKVNMAHPSEEEEDGTSTMGDMYSSSAVNEETVSHRSPSVASCFTDEDTLEDTKSRSSVGFRTPALPVYEEEEEQDEAPHGGFLAVAALTSDPFRARQELYQRYLYKPDTWAQGLKQYFKKPVFKERSQGLLGMGPSPSPMGLTPKTGSNLFPQFNPGQNNRRVMSAFPTTQIRRKNESSPLISRRVTSAGFSLKNH